ncbi:GD13821 [Drosophila simulans]|uniref:GD13821 n=1 Tax=Drosophila simulans TaxID=7240 RepID=B4QQH2_DROSI|nr:GD13821 [Drosophila simulans]
MGDEQDKRTGKEKLLFYTTAFFILLGTFSLFAFLFLVPFVIEPAFTTIFMQFEEVPALCETYDTEIYYGAKNCSWSSCREGCTKDIYTCTQIRVNYRLNLYNFTDEFNFTEYHINLKESERILPPVKRTDRYERALRSDYEYDNLGGGTGLDIDLGGGRLEQLNFGDADGSNGYLIEDSEDTRGLSASGTLIPDERRPFDEISELNEGLMGNRSMYYYVGARLFPNVDPSLVILHVDYWQNTLNLVYSMAIPIPSFIISVIYLTYAYFKIYNEDEETAPLDKNAEDMDIDDIDAVDDSDGAVLADNVAGSQIINMDSTTNDSCLEGVLPNGGPGMTASISQGGSVTTPGPYIAQSPAGSQMTPNSEINSFGHQLKVQMADELSRDSLENGAISTSNSKLEQDDDDEYLNSSWADSGSLKRQAHGLENVRFRFGK